MFIRHDGCKEADAWADIARGKPVLRGGENEILLAIAARRIRTKFPVIAGSCAAAGDRVVDPDAVDELGLGVGDLAAAGAAQPHDQDRRMSHRPPPSPI